MDAERARLSQAPYIHAPVGALAHWVLENWNILQIIKWRRQEPLQPVVAENERLCYESLINVW